MSRSPTPPNGKKTKASMMEYITGEKDLADLFFDVATKDALNSWVYDLPGVAKSIRSYLDGFITVDQYRRRVNGEKTNPSYNPHQNKVHDMVQATRAQVEIWLTAIDDAVDKMNTFIDLHRSPAMTADDPRNILAEATKQLETVTMTINVMWTEYMETRENMIVNWNTPTELPVSKRFMLIAVDDGFIVDTFNAVETAYTVVMEFMQCAKAAWSKIVVTEGSKVEFKKRTDIWEISRDEISLQETLGTGNFGQVKLGKWRNKVTLAVKMMNKGCVSKDLFLREADIMKTLRHLNIVTLYGVCTIQEPYYILMEFMPGGDLLNHLRQNDLRTDDLMAIVKQICDGMIYLETLELVHRDMAARNVLLDDHNHAKIADFGLARALVDGVCNSEGGVFPLRWTAPEAATSGSYSVKTDVWAFGILMVEVFSQGEVPYKEIDNKHLLKKLSQGYRHPQPAECPDDVYQIMLRCWDAKAENRPAFTLVRQLLVEAKTADDSDEF